MLYLTFVACSYRSDLRELLEITQNALRKRARKETTELLRDKALLHLQDGERWNRLFSSRNRDWDVRCHDPENVFRNRRTDSS